MVGWKDLAIIGGVAIGVGALAKYTGAGKGLLELGESITEFVVRPIREGARAVIELSGGFQKEVISWTDLINKFAGVKPPYVSGGCVTIPREEPCPTDQAYVRMNGQCCYGESARQCIPRGLFQNCPPEYPESDFWAGTCCTTTSTRQGVRPQPPAPVKPLCESYTLPGVVGIYWKSGTVGFGNQADCEAYRMGGR